MQKKLDSSFREGKIKSTYFFFLAAYYACLNETILNVYKVAIYHRESVTIHSLVRYAKDHPTEFRFATENDLLQLARTHKGKMKKFKVLLENVETQRDKVVAHLDTAFVENPQDMRSLPKIDMNEIEPMYLVTLDIVNGYSKYYDNSEYFIKNLNDGVEEDLNFILTRINKK